MLNSLASYLLGYPTPNGSEGPANAIPEITADVPTAGAAADVRLSAVEADDDWLLVDKSEGDEVEAVVPSATARLTLAVSSTSYHWPDSEEGVAVPCLEESWYVTPPPCFTSGSVPLETSPLENLLIEHPSMSVYHRSAAPQNPPNALSSSVGASPPSSFRSPQRSNLRKLHGAKARPVTVESSAPARTAMAEGDEASEATSPSRAVSAQTSTVPTTPRRPNAFSPYQQQQQQQLRHAQKLVHRAACQQLKRDSLERNNKAREILSSRNKRQRRSDHMQRHSGANNNRKC